MYVTTALSHTLSYIYIYIYIYIILSLTKFQASLNITVVISYLFLIMINFMGVVAFIDSFTVVISVALKLLGRVIYNFKDRHA